MGTNLAIVSGDTKARHDDLARRFSYHAALAMKTVIAKPATFHHWLKFPTARIARLGIAYLALVWSWSRHYSISYSTASCNRFVSYSGKRPERP